MKNTSPLLAIRCLAYNHEPYIRQCLEGFVMQKTDFPFVAIVHDDASTDKTADIIREYAEKYPDIIKPIFESENKYSKHDGSIRRIMNAAMPKSVKYIAVCEGDDYWTDPEKLQKQVGFLERNPEYVFCCHRFKIYNESNKKYYKEYAYSYYGSTDYLEIDEQLFCNVWITQTLTAVVDAVSYYKVQEYVNEYSSFRDVHQFFHLLKVGKGVSLNDIMGVYRWNQGGVHSQKNGKERYRIQYNVWKELYLKNKDEYLLSCYKRNLIKYIRYKPFSFYETSLYFEAFSICNTNREKIGLVISILTPRLFMMWLGRVYRKYYLKHQEISK